MLCVQRLRLLYTCVVGKFLYCQASPWTSHDVGFSIVGLVGMFGKADVSLPLSQSFTPFLRVKYGSVRVLDGVTGIVSVCCFEEVVRVFDVVFGLQ